MATNNIRRIPFMRKRLKQPGLPPGTIVSPREEDSEPTRVRVYRYSAKKFIEKETIEVTDLKLKKGETLWIDIVGLRNVDVIKKIAKLLDLHPLLVEDVMHTDQRPKYNTYANGVYIAVRMFLLNKEIIDSEQVSLFIGKHVILSFQERKAFAFDPIRERLRTGGQMINSEGPDYLGYTLLDTIVDNYFVILEDIGERIETLEDMLVQDPHPRTLQSINRLKQEAIFLRRSVWPLRDVIGHFERDESGFVDANTKVYVRDVYDHAIQVIESIETYRDVLSGLVDVYLSSVSNKMNAIMKVLTVITTIFIPLTFIAGIYGMNFKHMPELEWTYGYPVVLLCMVIVFVVMIWYFKRKKWF